MTIINIFSVIARVLNLIRSALPVHDNDNKQNKYDYYMVLLQVWTTPSASFLWSARGR